MIRFIPFLIGIFLANNSWSQDWFPNDASWYYTQTILGWGDTYRHFEVTGDTSILGKSCKIISGFCNGGWVGEPGYLYQEGDKIFAYNFEVDSFRILYDFNLVAGDTLIYEGGPILGGDGMFLIDSVTYIQAGSLNLRVQHITQLGIYMVFGDIIIERIGSNRCLYPENSTHYPFTGPLRCYEDSETGLLHFQPQVACDYDFSTSTRTTDDFQSLVVYPNPTDGILHIEFDHVIEKIELFNALSNQRILNLTYFNTIADFSIESLPPGIFYLRITTSDGIFLRLVSLQK